MADTQRALFPSDLQAIRDFLPQLLPVLEAEVGWYGSVYLERKTSRSYSANLKKTDVSEQVVFGAVLRIYDGHTLYEQGTDDLSQESLKAVAQKIAQRAKENAKSRRASQSRPYNPPTWSDRLRADLEDEIRTQVPKRASASIPVHFGIRFQDDPRVLKAQDYFKKLNGLIQKAIDQAPAHNLSKEDISFVASRLGLAEEISIFVDRESNMSQSLLRMSMTLRIMSGPEFVYTVAGGLGGLETVELPENTMSQLLDDLRELRKAERLKPGKYRVLFSPAVSGVLAHEAFGHSQEGDTCARGRSKAWDLHKSGEIVGNEEATILNNPAIYENGPESFAAWGSYFFDEEGWLAQEQVLLEKGKLKSPMTNLTSAIRLGVPRSANGKRESWAHGVYTRQTNTYFSAGKFTLNELIAKIDYGFMATHPAGGMEDPKGMGIQVGLAYLKEIKDGKFTGRVFRGPEGGDIQLTGYTPNVLESIVAKSKIEAGQKAPDEARHPTNDVGGCGKYHKEFVNAGCGGPYLLLDNVILG